MASSIPLFEGTPQTATSYSTSATEKPKWMQDAIYNATNAATALMSRPYEGYALPTVAELSPLQQQAYTQIQQNQGAWQPEMSFASSGMQNLAGAATADQLREEQNQYLRQGLVDQNLNAGQNYWSQAGGMDIVGAAQPYMGQAGAATAEALSERALSAASPYLQQAAQSSASQVGDYMNPYTQNVMDVIAKQGARNLSENLLPSVSDAFIRAGQFGGTRMGEFGSRALRDTQEAILNQQAQAAQQGYGQALNAAQTDLARQAGLAGTVGSISGADLSRILSGGAQYGNLAQTAGQLTGQQMQNLMSLGQMQTGAGQAQQQFGLNAAQAAQAASAGDISRQMSALNSIAAMAGQGQQLRTADAAALEAAGQSQQTQAQRELDAAQNQWREEQNYPTTQLNQYINQLGSLQSGVPTMQSVSNTSTGQTYSPSPLTTAAQGYATYKGITNL